MSKFCVYTPLILLLLAITGAVPSAGIQQKIRQKREWIIPPRKLTENVNYMHLDYIAKIRSDEETRTSIRYSLTGPGADQPPFNLFTVGSQNGLVKIHGVLDREERAFYHLRGVAKFLNGSNAEKDIDLRIVVLDQNDCAPVFNNQMSGSVPELSSRDTYVTSITATDADEEGTLHSKITYSIVEQSHTNMFKINQESGGIYVQLPTLDREIQDTYTLTVKGTDMNGATGGKTGTGKVVIHILDVNDNIPTLEKNFFECSVEENRKNVEVVRIQAIDADLIHTDNWLAVFSIVSGNEAGYFSITTDINTNEGILMLNKELDYEELKEISLQVSVSNKAAYHSSVVITQSKTYRIKVSVVNQAEGPRFKPTVKVITLSEDITSIDFRKVITSYAAIDSDTLLIAKNVRYEKRQDIDNWLLIDEKTADIRLNKMPDYESKFLINGTYYAQIICITNDTTSIFRSHATLWPGVYRLFVKVRDQQGKFCAHQALQIDVCACDASKVCLPRKREVRFGAAGVLLMLLGLLLLLLFPLLLLFCICSGVGHAADFKSIPFDTKEHLIVYNTEGQGDDKEMDLLEISKQMEKQKVSNVGAVSGGQTMIDGVDGAVVDWSSFHQYDMHGNAYHHHIHQFDRNLMYAQNTDEQIYTRFKGHDAYEGLAVSDAFLDDYYSHKARSVAEEHDTGDCLQVYNYEGQESWMGSFEDICSLAYEEDNLAFLDELDLKFKTLAEICSGFTMETDVSVTIPVAHKTVPSVKHLEKVSLVHSQDTENTSFIQATGTEQVNTVPFTGAFIHEKVVSSNPTLLIQQPALYYTPTNPVYVVDTHSALLVTAGPVRAEQENLLLVEKKNFDRAQHSQTVRREVQQYQGVVLVENQQRERVSLPAQGRVSGAVQMVEAEMIRSTETHGVRQVLHPTSRVMSPKRESP
ncbi:desmoglein-2-like protein isoform X2 [Misgurnus anguillicaudatus]|uniref:desmoglein-2-like protein isoform X2 n=1 Tax=Misgurnus anguillicaudatus TaxID=75329 RepID=UPI003CCF3CFD